MIKEKKAIILFGGNGKLGKYIVQNLIFDKSIYSVFVADLEVNCEDHKSKQVKYKKCNANNYSEILKLIKEISLETTDVTAINLIGFDFPIQNNLDRFTTPISITDKELTLSMELNLGTSHKIVKALIELEIISHIIFISSIYANKPTNSNLYSEANSNKNIYKPYIYGATKAAQEKLAKDLSVFLPKYNSRINVLALGGIDLEIPKEFIEKYSSWSPQNCMVNPLSALETLRWLIIDSPQELNGCILNLDSGLSNT